MIVFVYSSSLVCCGDRKFRSLSFVFCTEERAGESPRSGREVHSLDLDRFPRRHQRPRYGELIMNRGLNIIACAPVVDPFFVLPSLGDQVFLLEHQTQPTRTCCLCACTSDFHAPLNVSTAMFFCFWMNPFVNPFVSAGSLKSYVIDVFPFPCVSSTCFHFRL